MHDILKSFEQKPTPHFNKNSKVLKKSQTISKTLKVRSKIMKCMIKKEKVSHQMKNKDLETEDEVRKMKRLSFGCLGEGEKPFY